MDVADEEGDGVGESLGDEALGDVVHDESRHTDKVLERSPRGRFSRFNRRLGVGSSKVVYLAFDNDTGREVAWNVVSVARLARMDRKRIEREIQVLSSLDHPRVIKFISAWVNREKHEVVLITERVSGGSLRSYIRRLDSPLKLKVIRQWCGQILEGIAYLHSMTPNPIIHRDLKCDNIFVHGNAGNLVIGDLGLCTTFISGSPHYTIVGTPEFMAPELYEETSYGPPIDVYAFGMCLLEMCSRQSPFPECDTPGQIYRKVIRGDKPANVGRVRHRELRAIIESCLISDPARRPSAEDLLSSPFWTQIEGGDEFVELIHQTEKLCSPEDLIAFSDKSEEGSRGDQLEEPQLESIERKQSVSFCKEGRTLTKEALSCIPETAQVESACRLLNILRIDDVALFINTPKDGGMQKISFDYVLSVDSPAAVASQLIEAGLLVSPLAGGPSLERAVSKINEALLTRVQEIVSRFSKGRVEDPHVNIPSYTVNSYRSTCPPPSM